ncbi:ECF RNA polymerase sigma factor SigL [Bacillus sp. THAF10]|uniref:RNA polymerase sigma factor n=1 Tax=Bacillus sp. THAF10 TaxID=2587848 RepID=UPI001268FE6C|nr:RNA polymerase sigma factor [Bacillus sp. THAF10]QFT87921.1 ECF RNA polymerase sigma factor SigL [Bacillus sp. THAF10]
MVFENLEETVQKLYKYCLKLSGSSWRAEDLVQETMLKVYKLSKDDPKRPLTYSFLYTIAKNLFLDEQRKARRIEYFHEEEIRSEDFTEYDSLIEILLTTLPLKQAMLLTLKDVFGYTTKEIATMLRVSNESIKTSLHRSRKALKSTPSEKQPELSHPKILLGISTAIKEANAKQLFFYYRILEANNYRVRPASRKKAFHVVDPSGNVLEIARW